MAEPLLVEIVAYAPTAYYHCTHCEVAWREIGVTNHLHDEQVESSLPVELARDYQAVSDWVRDLFARQGDRVVVKVIDAASLEGVVKSLRYGVRRFPAIIVGREARFSGEAADALQGAAAEVDRRVQQTPGTERAAT
ncbi:MAG TPA: DUF1525 domain-containing protein [Anaerolineae bacterium]